MSQDPLDITSEIDALTNELKQDREAGLFLGKGQQPVVSELSRQLRASIRYDAINGTATERAICGSQMIRAADRLDHLEAENAALIRQWNELDLRTEKRHREWSDQLTAATSRAEQAVALLSHSRCLDDDQRTEAKLWRRHRDAFLGEQAARLRVEAAKNSRPVA